MSLSFKDEAIEEALKEFSGAEKASLNLMSDWRLQKQSYIDRINALLRDEGNTSFRIDQNTVGDGENTFRVHKVKRALQTYRITDDTQG